MAARARNGSGRRSGRSPAARARRLVRVWVDLFDRHGLLTYASAIALQALVAAVALALLALGVLGALGRTDVWDARLGPQVSRHVLPQVFAGVDATVHRIFSHDSTGLIVFASLLAVWEVSGSVRACMGALTRIYDAPETRPWWVRFPVSFGLAAAIVAALLGALLLVVTPGGPGSARLALDAGRWAAAVVLVGLAFGLLVRFGPAERRAKRWASAGAGLVVCAWIVQSVVFSWYVGSAADFRSAAGSLLVLLVLTSYFYTGAIVLLVGIELDELLRKDAREAERGLLELAREAARSARRAAAAARRGGGRGRRSASRGRRSASPR